MIFLELPQVCALLHLKAALEQVLGEEILGISNHLLFYGLQDKGSVDWKLENIYNSLRMSFSR